MQKSESKLLYWSNTKGIDEFVCDIAKKGHIENVNITPLGINNGYRIIVNVLYEAYADTTSKDLLIKSLDVIYNDKKISINHLQSKLEIFSSFFKALSIIKL